MSESKEIIARLNPEEKFTTHISVEGHEIIADEPASSGGNNKGPTPYGLLASGLAACTIMTMQWYSDRKGWKVKEFRVFVSHGKDYAEDCENCEDSKDAMIYKFNIVIEVDGDVTDEQKLKLIDIANKCPVHRTLKSPIEIETKFRD